MSETGTYQLTGSGKPADAMEGIHASARKFEWMKGTHADVRETVVDSVEQVLNKLDPDMDVSVRVDGSMAVNTRHENLIHDIDKFGAPGPDHGKVNYESAKHAHSMFQVTINILASGKKEVQATKTTTASSHVLTSPAAAR